MKRTLDLTYAIFFAIAFSFCSVAWSQETTIPQLKITTIDNIAVPNDKKYVYATAALIDENTVVDLDTIKIRTRGNSTRSFPKKPYQIKFEKSTSILGMPEDERWILLANYSDKTLLRTELALLLSRASNLAYTPQSKFLEVCLNEKYQGLYQCTQKVEHTENRVNIGESGFLLEVEMRKRMDANDICFTTKHETICIKSPEIDKEDSAYTEIKIAIRNIENILFSKDFQNPQTGWRKYIDEEALIDWYLINEITKNNDAKFHTSVFMTFESGHKLVMGPVWDYDISLGNIDYNGNQKPQGLWIKKAPWISRVYQDPAFRLKVKSRFEYFYSNKEQIKEQLLSKANRIKNAQQRDNAKWQVIGKKVWPNYKNFDTYEEELDYLTQWFDIRMDWLQETYAKL